MRQTKIYQFRWIALYLPIFALALLAFALLSAKFLPMPDDQLTISTGRVGGMYQLHAHRYAKLLAEQGITLKMVDSAGSGENLQRLRSADQPVQIGFVQGGYASSEAMTLDSATLKTVANMDIEPIWVFSRFTDVESLLRLQGSRVWVGQKGSGSRAVAIRMLSQVRLTANDLFLAEISSLDMTSALRTGRIDAAIFVAAADAPVVQELLGMPGVYLAMIKRSAAISERMPYLDARFVAAGSLHSQSAQPKDDMVLLSTLASVLIRDDVHPLLKRRFAHVVREAHSGAGLLHRAGEFPNLRRLEFPSDQDSRKVLQSGLPWVEQYLSVGASQWVYRIVLLGIPLLALTWLMCKSIPAVLAWRVQARINRWYGELKFIENEIRTVRPSGLELAKTRARINNIAKSMQQIAVPVDFMKRMVVLHHHLQWVQSQIHERQGR
jgi:uncharacterized protein